MAEEKSGRTTRTRQVTRDLDMEKLESTRHNARQDATERGCETD